MSEPGARVTAATRLRCAQLSQALLAQAEPLRAPAMQAYMKSAMPFAGVAAPVMRRTCQAQFRAWWPLQQSEWLDTIQALWDTAQVREQRYAAIELLRWRPARDYRTPQILPQVERMIVEGAWWDLVDAIVPVVGEILQGNPRVAPTIRRWSRHDDLWLRRSAILCQLTFKQHTQLDLLYACIEPSLDSREFFLRKAIGWALRQLARSMPDEVRCYVDENAERLSPLSRREALKHLESRR